MGILTEMLNNKLLLYSAIAVIFFIVISIILIKKVSGEKEEEEAKIDIKKIEGENSVFDEIIEEKEKSNSNQLDLDSMIAKMQQDLDAKASEVVEKFETEQEEKSVISYQELIGNKKEENIQTILDNVVEPVEMINGTSTDEYQSIDAYEENTNSLLEKLDNVEKSIASEIVEEPIEIENVEPVSKLNMKDEFVEAIKTGNYVEEHEITSPEEVIEKEPSKFKATEFISPIYGIQDIKIQYPTIQNMKDFKEKFNRYNKVELDNTLDIQKVDKEVHQDEDFLNSLKEFRKNLQ